MLHPRCGEVCFIITFLTRHDLEKFKRGPQLDFEKVLSRVVMGGRASYAVSGCLMPAAHTLSSLVCKLRDCIVGNHHKYHNVRQVCMCMCMCMCVCVCARALRERGTRSWIDNCWIDYPIPNQVQLIFLKHCRSKMSSRSGFLDHPNICNMCTGIKKIQRGTLKSVCNKEFRGNNSFENRYTRNPIFSNENMDILLMCWPPGCVSSIHDHDNSRLNSFFCPLVYGISLFMLNISCWVVVVEGEVEELQYQLPCLDRKFIDTEMANHTGAWGRCGPLRVVNQTKLNCGLITATYANNDIGIHQIKNTTQLPAYTMHVYAPPLRKFKIFQKGENEQSSGSVKVCVVGGARKKFDPGFNTVVDVDAWNDKLTGKCNPANFGLGSASAAI